MDDDNKFVGEILIPLEDTINNDSNEFDVDNILNCDCFKFRKIVFQNENLRFFVLLKSEKKILKIIEKLNVKIEFKLIEENDENNNNNNKINEKIIGNFYSNFCMNELILKNKKYLKENFLIFEYEIKSIFNENILNKNVNMIISYEKENFSFEKIDFSELIFYNEILNKKNIIKKIKKRIKIIQPLKIIKIKQFDINPNLSLINLKLINETLNINFFDFSLKNSNFLNFIENDFDFEKNEKIFFGIDFIIKDILFNKNNTKIDYKMRLNLDNFEEFINKEEIFVPKNFLNFQLLNKKFPIILKAGEEFNISLKIHKNFLNLSEKIFNYSKKENVFNNIKNLFENNNNNNENNFFSNSSNSMIKLEKNTEKYMSQNLKSKFKIFPKISKKRKDFLDENFNKKKITKDKKIITELIKINLESPFLILLNSNKKIENFQFKVILKWKTDIDNKINIKFIILEEKIINFNFFHTKLIFKNLDKKPSEFSLIFHNSFEDLKIDNNYLNLPDLLSEFKNYEIGLINPQKEKELILRFFPIKINYLNFPTFNVIEHLSNKNYFVLFSNKIFVNKN